MAKKLLNQVKVQAIGGQATPAPPLGPVLGQAGINIGEFVNQFNEQTRESRMGEVVPVVINVYEDRSFDFVCKTTPASRLILKAINKDKGSSKPSISKGGEITTAQLREIAEAKMADLNANDLDQATKIIAGTARSMGIEVK
ncbi:50S ribosomal protein L11 [bacterium]|nr:50S ribosomal protein L11 [bacterium]|tara:strand:+ start:172 stop:597 length:426 start_codon:yes stop_codon:yes gene_type:complete